MGASLQGQKGQVESRYRSIARSPNVRSSAKVGKGTTRERESSTSPANFSMLVHSSLLRKVCFLF